MTAPQIRLQAFLDSCILPGFDRRVEVDSYHTGLEGGPREKMTSVVLSNADDTIRIAVNVYLKKDWESGKESPSANGHVWFKKPGKNGWFGFDRRGVEDSFYMEEGEDFAAVAEEQFARIRKSISVETTLIAIPGIPFRVTPDRLTDHKQRLSSGGSTSFMPSGFGTGYRVSTKKTRFSKTLPEETAALLGVANAYYETFDVD